MGVEKVLGSGIWECNGDGKGTCYLVQEVGSGLGMELGLLLVNSLLRFRRREVGKSRNELLVKRNPTDTDQDIGL